MKPKQEDWARYGIDPPKGRVSGKHKVKCPRCAPDRRKHKTDTSLSIDLDDGAFKCHHCEWKGYVLKSVYQPNMYTKPPVKEIFPIFEGTLKWFREKRGISQETLREWNVSTAVAWMPEIEVDVAGVKKKVTDRQVMEFNHYDGSELVNIQYRDAYKNFRMFKGAQLIFYGLNNIKESDEAIIVEGHIDALSFWEAGKICDDSRLMSVVSVPNGASISENSDYIEHAKHWLENKSKIYIAVDMDAKGLELRDELVRRLGKERCFIVKFPAGKKDANELLTAFRGVDEFDSTEFLDVKRGAYELQKCLDNAEACPVDGVFSLESFRDDLIDIYQHGRRKGLDTHIPDMQAYLKIRQGEVTGVTGYPGDGKSTFVKQIMLNMSVMYQWGWAIYSPEHAPLTEFYIESIEMLAGKSTDIIHADRMSEYEMSNCMEFLNSKFHMIHPGGTNYIEDVLDRVKYLIYSKGIKGVLIDPWNKIARDNDDVNTIRKTLATISAFAKKHQVHIFLVAHPSKPADFQKSYKDQEGKEKIRRTKCTAYSISGGAEFYNQFDNIMVVHRNDPKDLSDDSVVIIVEKVKYQKINGKPGSFLVRYNPVSGRYVDVVSRQFVLEKECERITKGLTRAQFNYPDELDLPV